MKHGIIYAWVSITDHREVIKDKLKLTGQNLIWAESSTLDAGVHMYTIKLHSKQKQPNLNLKTWPKLTFRFSPVSFSIPKNHGLMRMVVDQRLTHKCDQVHSNDCLDFGPTLLSTLSPT